MRLPFHDKSSIAYTYSVETILYDDYRERRPTMNPLNYASLEASKRLVDNGILLETEAVWHLQGDNETYFLQSQGSSAHLCVRWGDFPAPCMAEVWRELPDEFSSGGTRYGLQLDKIKRHDGVVVSSAQYDYEFEDLRCVHSFKANTNPTDALIDLLIWQRKEAKPC